MERTAVDKSYDTDFVKACLDDEEMQCWVGVDNDEIKVAHITIVDDKPKRSILHIPLTGAVEGTIDEWLEQHLEVFKEFARMHGCSTIRGYGRYGWIKKLKPADWRVEFDIEV